MHKKYKNLKKLMKNKSKIEETVKEKIEEKINDTYNVSNEVKILTEFNQEIENKNINFYNNQM